MSGGTSKDKARRRSVSRAGPDGDSGRQGMSINLVDVILAAWMVVALVVWIGVVLSIPAPGAAGLVWIALVSGGMIREALGAVHRMRSGP